MQQVDNLRGRLSQLNPQAQWVQLGLLSASIMAPLIGRWNELRTAERARALREEAETRLRGMRTQLPWQRKEALDQVAALLTASNGGANDTSNARGKAITRLWLVGVGVGLVAAGAGAYILVRRRMEQSIEEPLVDLPLKSVNGYAQSAGNGFNGNSHTLAASSNAGAAKLAATAAPRVPILTDEQTFGQVASQTPEGDTVSAIGRMDEKLPADAMQSDDAPFIGNIRTMLYHAAGTYNLPAEENRIYFVSEDEARAAGYRRVHDEAPVPEAESQAQSNP